MRTIRRTSIAVVLVAALLTLSACSSSTDEATTTESSTANEQETAIAEAEAVEEEVVVEPESDSSASGESPDPQLDIFFSLLKEAQIDVTFFANHTIFAPANEAFNALDESVLEALQREENADALFELLMYHVVFGTIIMPDDGTNGPVVTPSGAMLDISTQGSVSANGVATSNSWVTSNSVTYAIPSLLTPPGFDVNSLITP